VGKGSVFTFQVQIKDGDSNAVKTNSPKKVICIDKSEEVYRILVVDDKEENLKVAVTLLNIVGFETNEAVNGEDAVAKFEDWKPDLILMDMRMPVMDGYEATRKIKSTEKGMQTPIVALTASTFEDELKHIDSLGMQGYIRKPFREHELFSTIGKILGINYIYDTETQTSELKYLNNPDTLADDLLKIPGRLVLKMQQALAVADLDLLIELIKSMEKDNPELSEQLMYLAVNYNYDYLQQILNKKEK